MNTQTILSFDIETEGLDARTCSCTVVCTYDGKKGNVYHLQKPATNCTCLPPLTPKNVHHHLQCEACSEWHQSNAAALFSAMDRADWLCGFNCIKFDIPFLQARFSIEDERVKMWTRKTLDIFLFVSEVLQTPCQLKRMLAMNGMPSKSGSGKEAIVMAHKGEWNKLASYCMDDARLTHNLTTMPEILVPAYNNTTTVRVHLTANHCWKIVEKPNEFSGGGGNHDKGHRKRPFPRAVYDVPVQSLFQ